MSSTGKVSDGCIIIIIILLLLYIYIDNIIFRETLEREELEILHRSVQVKCSCLGYFCDLLGFCIRC